MYFILLYFSLFFPYFSLIFNFSLFHHIHLHVFFDMFINAAYKLLARLSSSVAIKEHNCSNKGGRVCLE